ncbi:NAD(P)/FAD-dependent oxidoreductase [uncultured Pseudokineococcus sp.]|uniref:NAD(P)/FAD-dependent oxidoreductase n=1 Tax=uncultured Pseudokineococcus sp. TaxID=1642928 RepID=UPI0026145868|nr:FAD-dependent oxidoreductase [uncultured Pseudokineococcus sp.]
MSTSTSAGPPASSAPRPSPRSGDAPAWDAGAVVVVGAGIAGLACARSLRDGGLDVVVLDRGRSPGGRLGLRRTGKGTDAERVVDVGASYAVPRATSFTALAESWRARGVTGPWTDTLLAVSRDDGGRVTSTPKPGPVRWSAPGGLRSLTDDLAEALAGDGVPVREHDVRRVDRDAAGALSVDGHPCRAVVLAMPEPQAVRLVGPGLSEETADLRDRAWTPVITVWARWDEAWWPAMDGAFVSGSPAVEFVADDGRRRGDGAPVLVAHSTPQLARDHLGDPPAAVAPVLAELGALLGRGEAPAPVETGAQRWTFARPDGGRPETSRLSRGLGVCGDGWGERPGVEQAWLSGTELGGRLAAEVAGASPRT